MWIYSSNKRNKIKLQLQNDVNIKIIYGLKKKKTYIWAKYISLHLIINHPKSEIL